MRELFVKICWPILKPFENGSEQRGYRKSHRVALIAVGALFLLLGIGCGALVVYSGQFGAFIPVVVFVLVGLVALVVGLLGSDGAVCKIWGSK